MTENGEVTFVDELPPKGGNHSGAAQHREFKAVLLAHPGKWALAPHDKSSAAREWAKKNGLEMTSRQGVAYIRAPE